MFLKRKAPQTIEANVSNLVIKPSLPQQQATSVSQPANRDVQSPSKSNSLRILQSRSSVKSPTSSLSNQEYLKNLSKLTQRIQQKKTEPDVTSTAGPGRPAKENVQSIVPTKPKGSRLDKLDTLDDLDELSISTADLESPTYSNRTTKTAQKAPTSNVKSVAARLVTDTAVGSIKATPAKNEAHQSDSDTSSISMTATSVDIGQGNVVVHIHLQPAELNTATANPRTPILSSDKTLPDLLKSTVQEKPPTRGRLPSKEPSPISTARESLIVEDITVQQLDYESDFEGDDSERSFTETNAPPTPKPQHTRHPSTTRRRTSDVRLADTRTVAVQADVSFAVKHPVKEQPLPASVLQGMALANYDELMQLQSPFNSILQNMLLAQLNIIYESLNAQEMLYQCCRQTLSLRLRTVNTSRDATNVTDKAKGQKASTSALTYQQSSTDHHS